MKGAVVCDKGLEDISCVEVGELIGAKCEKREGVVVFEVKDLKDLCVLCYKAQSVYMVLYLFLEAEFDDLEKEIDNLDFKEWVEGKSFAVRAECSGELSSKEVEEKVGGFVFEKVKGLKAKVDLENPDVTFFVHVRGKKCYFGVDFAGFDLGKREYKVFSHPASLKGPVAYGLVRLAGFEKGEFLLSSFTKGGVVVIEATLFASGMPVNYYRKDKFAFLGFKIFEGFDFDGFFDKLDEGVKKEKLKILGVSNDLRHLSAGKKNAKIAGVSKMVGFSKMDVDWLDVKFKKGEVDRMIAYPVGGEKEKMKEFFHQAEYVLSGEGKIVVVGEGFDEFAKEKKFEKVGERVIERGKGGYVVKVYKKVGKV